MKTWIVAIAIVCCVAESASAQHLSKEWVVNRYGTRLHKEKYGIVIDKPVSNKKEFDESFYGPNVAHIFLDENGIPLFPPIPHAIPNFQYVIHIVNLKPVYARYVIVQDDTQILGGINLYSVENYIYDQVAVYAATSGEVTEDYIEYSEEKQRIVGELQSIIQQSIDIKKEYYEKLNEIFERSLDPEQVEESERLEEWYRLNTREIETKQRELNQEINLLNKKLNTEKQQITEYMKKIDELEQRLLEIAKDRKETIIPLQVSSQDITFDFIRIISISDTLHVTEKSDTTRVIIDGDVNKNIKKREQVIVTTTLDSLLVTEIGDTLWFANRDNTSMYGDEIYDLHIQDTKVTTGNSVNTVDQVVTNNMQDSIQLTNEGYTQEVVSQVDTLFIKNTSDTTFVTGKESTNVIVKNKLTRNSDIDNSLLSATSNYDTLRVTYHMSILSMYHAEVDFGFIKSHLSNPIFGGIQSPNDSTKVIPIKKEAGRQGFLAVMATIYINPIVFIRHHVKIIPYLNELLFIGKGAPKYQWYSRSMLYDPEWYEKLYPTVGVQLTDRGEENMLLGFSIPLSSCANIFFGCHYGKVNTFRADRLTFGEGEISKTEYKIREDSKWEHAWAYGININLQIGKILIEQLVPYKSNL